MSYTIATIGDIMAVPYEHLDELFDDIRQAHETINGLHGLAVALGEGAPLRDMVQPMEFTPDGKGRRSITITPDERGGEG